MISDDLRVLIQQWGSVYPCLNDIKKIEWVQDDGIQTIITDAGRYCNGLFKRNNVTIREDLPTAAEIKWDIEWLESQTAFGSIAVPPAKFNGGALNSGFIPSVTIDQNEHISIGIGSNGDCLVFDLFRIKPGRPAQRLLDWTPCNLKFYSALAQDQVEVM